MKTLQELQEQAYATALAKGWHELPLREPGIVGTLDNARDEFIVHHDRVLRMHALMHTELTEAHDCLDESDLILRIDDGKPEGLVVEIADFIIRVCDTTKALGLQLKESLERASNASPACEIREAEYRGDRMVAALWIGHVRRYVDQATEAARVDDWVVYSAGLSTAVLYAASICEGFNLDIEKAIEAKMAYNETRSHRHGGKQA